MEEKTSETKRDFQLRATCHRFLPPDSSTFRTEGFFDELTVPPKVDSLISPLCYRGEVKERVQRAKFSGDLKEANRITFESLCILNSWLLEQSWDLIIPVPPHLIRTIKRGMHLPTKFADDISRQTRQIPLTRREKTALRWRWSFLFHTQHHRSQRERAHSGHNPFLSSLTSKETVSKAILLVDDVITTGSTLAAAAQTLRKLRPLRIDAITICHTHRNASFGG